MPSATAPSASIPVSASPPSTGQRSPSERISRSASSAPGRSAASSSTSAPPPRPARGARAQLLPPPPRGVLVPRIVDDPQLELAPPDAPFGVDLIHRQLGGPEHRGAPRLGERAREADGDRPCRAGARRQRESSGND